MQCFQLVSIYILVSARKKRSKNERASAEKAVGKTFRLMPIDVDWIGTECGKPTLQTLLILISCKKKHTRYRIYFAWNANFRCLSLIVVGVTFTFYSLYFIAAAIFQFLHAITHYTFRFSHWLLKMSPHQHDVMDFLSCRSIAFRTSV